MASHHIDHRAAGDRGVADDGGGAAPGHRPAPPGAPGQPAHAPGRLPAPLGRPGGPADHDQAGRPDRPGLRGEQDAQAGAQLRGGPATGGGRGGGDGRLRRATTAARRRAAAARLGLACHLLLRGGQKDGRPAQGNLLLDDLLGAEVRLLYGEALERWPETVAAYMEQLRGQGHVPYQVMNTLESDRLGAVAYMGAFLELQEQLRDVAQRGGPGAVRIYWPRWGAPAGGWPWRRSCWRPRCASSASRPWTRSRCACPSCWPRPTPPPSSGDPGAPRSRRPDDARRDHRSGVRDSHGGGHGCPAPGRPPGRDLLDPVYTAKAMAGLIDHIRRGVIWRDETVVFVHTGGCRPSSPTTAS